MRVVILIVICVELREKASAIVSVIAFYQLHLYCALIAE